MRGETAKKWKRTERTSAASMHPDSLVVCFKRKSDVCLIKLFNDKQKITANQLSYRSLRLNSN